jgi:LmbE family N-acetylglucosaminyl deacetylase
LQRKPRQENQDERLVEASYAPPRGGRDFSATLPRRVLVFAPHADDEVISCGGTILKYTQWRREVTVIVVTSGSGGRSNKEASDSITETRRKEFETAKEALGLSDRSQFLGMEELQVNRCNVRKFTDIVRDTKPDIVLYPHLSDRHMAHRNTALLAMEALYHAPTDAYSGHGRAWLPLGAYFYETPSGTFGQGIHAETLVISDITEQFEAKRKILKEVYASQKQFLSSLEGWIEALARFRGEAGRCKFGEAFSPDTAHVPLKLLIAQPTSHAHIQPLY